MNQENERQWVATGPYVERLIRIFQQMPDAGDYSAKVLLDFAKDSIAAMSSASIATNLIFDKSVPVVVRTAPERIYLQVSDEDYSHEPFPRYSEDQVTWCASSCVECEVEYVRADLAQDCEKGK